VTVAMLVLALAAALVDWSAVWRGHGRIEAAAKPAVMVLLIAAALSTDGDTTLRTLVVVGLVFGLVGDVFLLPAVDQFIGGLGAFLVGHLAYTIGFAINDLEPAATAFGIAAAAALALVAGRKVLHAVSTTAMAWPVRAYFLVISAMVATAIGTGSGWFGIGALTFALSDALLGHDKFVTPRSDRRVVVHVLYHLGQALIVVGLT
jgi:alkenylglycerophosphocholine/alkenylglycerophosphoethanolamine hydrolase